MAHPQADAHLDVLQSRLVPFVLHFFDELPSTSDRAAEMRRRGELVPPAVVVAERQTHGRGTRGRTWHSGQGSLTATFALPIHPNRPVHHLPLLAGLAVRDAVQKVVPQVEVAIKWSNDLLLDDRKLGGLLCERRDGVDLVGVGINLGRDAGVLPAELRDSVAMLPDVHWFDLLSGIAGHLDAALLAGDAPLLAERLGELRSALAWRGQVVSVETGGRRVVGVLEDIDSEGRLCVRDEAGHPVQIISGTLRRA